MTKRLMLLAMSVGAVTACGSPPDAADEVESAFRVRLVEHCRNLFPPGVHRGRCISEGMRHRPPCKHDAGVDAGQPDGSQAICGDGIVQPGEACDPPDGITCDSLCQPIPVACGNGIVQPGESCDPPDGITCDSLCQPIPVVCGNGIVQAGESCDPPDGTTCDAQCRTITVTCGNGIIEPGESCDPPFGATCDSQCHIVACGNGIVQGYEQCDPPNWITCDSQCRTVAIVCGNGIVQPGESCDPPNGTTCDSQCRGIPIVCGNGIVQPGETCDPPNGTTCDSQCHLLPTCGECFVGAERCDPFWRPNFCIAVAPQGCGAWAPITPIVGNNPCEGILPRNGPVCADSGFPLYCYTDAAGCRAVASCPNGQVCIGGLQDVGRCTTWPPQI